MRAIFIFYLLSIALLVSCDVIRSNDTRPVGEVEGLKPIYAALDNWDQISVSDPQPIGELGKIYYKEPFIYVGERNKGIHVLDNTNPANPIPVKFINVIGAEDIAIKGNILYADNVTDLVAIDISNLEDIKLTKRVKNLYDESKKDYPDGYNGYFECVEAGKGIVIGWEKTMLTNPECLR